MRILKIGVPIPFSGNINGGGYYLQAALIDKIVHYDFKDSKNLEFVYIANSHLHSLQFLEANPSVSPNQVLLLQMNLLDTLLGILDRYIVRPLRRLTSSRLPPNYSSMVLASKLKTNIDILWNLNPTSLSVELPFILPVWDLQHRLQPYFPEVSENGAWDIREEWYSKQIPRASLILTGTKRGATEICQFYGVDPCKVVVVPLPMILPKFSCAEGKVEEAVSAYGIEKPYIIYPANFWPHKNHYHLLLAIKMLYEQGSPIKLVLTGKKQGTFKAIQKLAIELNIYSRIYFTDVVNTETLQALYLGSIGLCYPSMFGPDNLPPLEALALGIPVATADVPGAREQLNDQVLYFNPCSPVEISKAIQTMLDHPITVTANGPICKNEQDSVSRYVNSVISHIEKLQPYIICANICRVF